MQRELAAKDGKKFDGREELVHSTECRMLLLLPLVLSEGREGRKPTNKERERERDREDRRG
jgi:hypothetical protein